MKTIQFIGPGALSTGNNASLSPAAPTDIIPGDVVCIAAAIRTGTPQTPAGWVTLAQTGGAILMARIWLFTDVMPTITFTGGAAGDDTIARSFILRYANPDLARIVNAVTYQSNGSAQDVAVPAVTSTVNGCLLLNIVFKQDDYTSLARTGYFFGVSGASTIGNDAGLGVMGKFQTSAGAEGAGTVTVTGGAGATSVAMAIAIAPFETTYASIPASDRPCDFWSDFTAGSDAACAALAATGATINILKNPPAVSVSAASGSVTDNAIVTFSSVDIDPTGLADLVADPNSVTITDGRWFTGWSAHVGTTTTFNTLSAGDGSDFEFQSAACDLDAALRYPADNNHAAGGASMCAANMKLVSPGATVQVSMQASFQGTTPPSGLEVTILKGVEYMFRMSD